jgi:hypothetical protein
VGDDIRSPSYVVRYLYFFEALYTVHLTSEIHLTATLISFFWRIFLCLCIAWKYVINDQQPIQCRELNTFVIIIINELQMDFSWWQWLEATPIFSFHFVALDTYVAFKPTQKHTRPPMVSLMLWKWDMASKNGQNWFMTCEIKFMGRMTGYMKWHQKIVDGTSDSASNILY